MKTYKDTLPMINMSYPLVKLGPKEQLLFLDIETTGFSADTSSIYLIGCCYFQGDQMICKQWFADTPAEEEPMLKDFLSFISSYSVLIHFNGNQFDLPFILKRCKRYNIPCSFDTFTGIDIYKRIYPYRYLLKLSNCKQKTIEYFLNINRDDELSGGELIEVYKSYCRQPEKTALQLLLLHNHDDVIGMIQLLPILTYTDLLHDKIKIKKVQSNTYMDVNQVKKKELLITFLFSSSFPQPISYHANDCYFSVRDNTGILKIPVYQEEMRYFYEDYKNYYYLPEEDTAIHKSVSSYVDPAYRQQATASNCYTRKFSNYLPQWDYLFEPFFKREYKSSNLFFELTDELKTDRAAFTNYVTHVLSMLIKTH